MVVQKKPRDMSPAELRNVEAIRKQLTTVLSDIDWDDLPKAYHGTQTKAGFRRGILNLTTDDPDHPRELRLHQSTFVYNILFNGDLIGENASFGTLNRSVVAMHDMGTGKTISAIALIAALYKKVPNVDDFRVLVVVPPNLLHTWYDALMEWTTLGSAGVTMIEEHKDLTEEVLARPGVLLVNKYAIVGAYKTYMWKNPTGGSYLNKKGEEVSCPAWVRGYDPNKDRSAEMRRTLQKRMDENDGVLPVHPLFAHVARRSSQTCPERYFNKFDPKTNHPEIMQPAFTLAIIDEVALECAPKLHFGHIMRLIMSKCLVKVGLTGTVCSSHAYQVADVCRLMCINCEYLQERKYWHQVGSASTSLDAATIARFQEGDTSDRVSKDHIAQVKVDKGIIHFAPFIGLLADNKTYDDTAIEAHDFYLNRAQNKVHEVDKGGRHAKWMDTLWSMFTTTVQYCFHNGLGHKGAEYFDQPSSAPERYKLALQQPSQQMRLIWRFIRDRQQKGHPRIAIYSTSVVMLKLLLHQLEAWGDCGTLFLYTGDTGNKKKRHAMLQEFLNPVKTPRGVLCLSAAGSHGLTICPGCEVMLVVGEMPWTSAALEQAMARIDRIGQDKDVEIKILCPHYGITAAKLEAHEDEAKRLYPAINDGDYTHLDDVHQQQWRQRAAATLNINHLVKEEGNNKGNYGPTRAVVELREKWLNDCESARANNQPEPDEPDACKLPTPHLADAYPLPECPFPVDGFVEGPIAPKPRDSLAYVPPWEKLSKEELKALSKQPKKKGKRTVEPESDESDAELARTDDEAQMSDLSTSDEEMNELCKRRSNAKGKQPMRALSLQHAAKMRALLTMDSDDDDDDAPSMPKLGRAGLRLPPRDA